MLIIKVIGILILEIRLEIKPWQSKHIFNYDLMKEINGGKQMKDVWTMTSPNKKEKEHFDQLNFSIDLLWQQ